MGLALVVSAYRGSKETSKWFKDGRTVVGCPTTPLVINGALYGPQEVNWSTSTKRNRGRSQSVVCARLPSEVSDPPALMKENHVSETEESIPRLWCLLVSQLRTGKDCESLFDCGADGCR